MNGNYSSGIPKDEEGITVYEPTMLKNDGEALSLAAKRFAVSAVDAIYSDVEELKKIWKGKAAVRNLDPIDEFKDEFFAFINAANDFGKLVEHQGNKYEQAENNL